MTDFYGLPTGTLSNDHLRLEYLAEAGPRLVRLFLNGSATRENLLAELPDVVWPTPFGPYRVHGGHRLWHAPEAMPRTYIADDQGLTVTALPDGVELIQPQEANTGLSKGIAVRLDPNHPALTLTHSIVNNGLWPVELSPWAITQLRLGGTIILPQPGALAEGPNLLPNRHLVLWPYTRLDDPRLCLGDDFWFVVTQPRLPPLKIGYLSTHAWVACLWDDVLFVKKFQPEPTLPHPDWNSNVEVYCNDRFVELETIAPLARLEPGEAATHVERWEFFTGFRAEPTPEGARALVRSLLSDSESAATLEAWDGNTPAHRRDRE